MSEQAIPKPVTKYKAALAENINLRIEIERLRTENEHLIYEKNCTILGLKERNAELLTALKTIADAGGYYEMTSVALAAIEKAEGQ